MPHRRARAPMRADEAGYAVGGSVVFVLLSSFLGLTGRFFFLDPASAFELMKNVWSASLVADAVFVAGSALAAILAFRLVERSFLTSVIVGAVANWLVYVSSFLLLPEFEPGSVGDVREAYVFVAGWGIVGLVFAALAPALAARWWQRRSAAAGIADADLASRS